MHIQSCLFCKSPPRLHRGLNFSSRKSEDSSSYVDTLLFISISGFGCTSPGEIIYELVKLILVVIV